MDSSPLLRWIGGKTKTINKLAEYVPPSFERYWEPFLGGASMFFYLKPQISTISDSNKDLINFYQIVQKFPVELSKEIELHKKKNSPEYYYHIRDDFNNGAEPLVQAGRFIYLNRACFNGIYRVNKFGKFNVPYGQKEKPNLPTFEKIKHFSLLLKSSTIKCGFFDSIIELGDVYPKDFFYFDPPYPPLNGTSNFTHYTSEKFNFNDQMKVAVLANELDYKGCRVLISNADTIEIRDLYKNWKVVTLPVKRWVSANGKRQCVNELVIFNYDKREDL